ncbi:hypothetical protein D5018_01340 [Parashewanella curva]|uniref:Uncharacterized protein n=1 Tax=Parashewanella curva TaxID=2338552 RepID=A0A3L8Q327_9GAMM|nr:hypothetical protein [Parashewanella curva]RLV61519.1 hypothetical protein D5018_01340 [Parashewanella curva]
MSLGGIGVNSAAAPEAAYQQPAASAISSVYSQPDGMLMVFNQIMAIFDSERDNSFYQQPQRDQAYALVHQLILGTDQGSAFSAFGSIAQMISDSDSQAQLVINKPKPQSPSSTPSTETVIFGFRFADGTEADVNRFDDVENSEVTRLQAQPKVIINEFGSDDKQPNYRKGFDGGLRGVENPITRKNYALPAQQSGLTDGKPDSVVEADVVKASEKMTKEQIAALKSADDAEKARTKLEQLQLENSKTESNKEQNKKEQTS